MCSRVHVSLLGRAHGRAATAAIEVATPSSGGIGDGSTLRRELWACRVGLHHIASSTASSSTPPPSSPSPPYIINQCITSQGDAIPVQRCSSSNSSKIIETCRLDVAIYPSGSFASSN